MSWRERHTRHSPFIIRELHQVSRSLNLSLSQLRSLALEHDQASAALKLALAPDREPADFGIAEQRLPLVSADGPNYAVADERKPSDVGHATRALRWSC